MIRAVFERGTGGYRAVSVSGHAGYAEEGEDIVCAAVTSAVQLVTNGISEVLKAPVSVDVGEDTIAVRLAEDGGKTAGLWLEALYLHLELLSEDYKDYIKLTIMEV